MLISSLFLSPVGFDFPAIDPVAFSIGPLKVRWYGIAYCLGLIFGSHYLAFLNTKPPVIFSKKALDACILWATFGIILGGRVGYACFYAPELWKDPLLLLQIYRGGMSFHGGVIGMAASFWIFSLYYKISFLHIADRIVCVIPIGLFFGRIANFINEELYGRITSQPWGVRFPQGGFMLRHPSQLYEAFLEGLVLFFLLFLVEKYTKLRYYKGKLAGVFFLFYGLFRTLIEEWREPDAHLGYIFGTLTMGQILTLPLIFVGLALYCWPQKPNVSST